MSSRSSSSLCCSNEFFCNARGRLVRGCFLIAGLLLLSGCGGRVAESTATANIEPVNYKEDTLAFLRTYLNDPSGIREAAISHPALKTVGGQTRYAACLRFNAKK